jgi:hypothetical protein
VPAHGARALDQRIHVEAEEGRGHEAYLGIDVRRVVPHSHLSMHADANPYKRYESHPEEVMVPVAAGSAVLINLRVLGLALRGQATEDLIRRLAPWTWTALPLLALSGLVFIVAQPYRYFDNPIFRLKFALMVPAIATTVAFHRRPEARGRLAVLLAALSLALWVGVVLAGRWIAYVDYLMPVE